MTCALLAAADRERAFEQGDALLNVDYLGEGVQTCGDQGAVWAAGLLFLTSARR